MNAACEQRAAALGRIHVSLIGLVRDAAKEDGGEFAMRLSLLADDQLVRMMFSNFRGSAGTESRGLRLTNFGQQVMKRYFRYYEVAMPEGQRLESHHLLYLDRRARMPYYCSDKGFTIFENDLGIKLKLADGRVDILIDIETG